MQRWKQQQPVEQDHSLQITKWAHNQYGPTRDALDYRTGSSLSSSLYNLSGTNQVAHAERLDSQMKCMHRTHPSILNEEIHRDFQRAPTKQILYSGSSN